MKAISTKTFVGEDDKFSMVPKFALRVALSAEMFMTVYH